jgi:hypothetical protein
VRAHMADLLQQADPSRGRSEGDDAKASHLHKQQAYPYTRWKAVVGLALDQRDVCCGKKGGQKKIRRKEDKPLKGQPPQKLC